MINILNQLTECKNLPKGSLGTINIVEYTSSLSVLITDLLPDLFKRYNKINLYFATETLKPMDRIKLISLVKSKYNTFNNRLSIDFIETNLNSIKEKIAKKIHLAIALIDNQNEISSTLIGNVNIAQQQIVVCSKRILQHKDLKETRQALARMHIFSIVNLSPSLFKGINEGILIHINHTELPTTTLIKCLIDGETFVQDQSYITTEELPHWVIFRNSNFDMIFNESRSLISTTISDQRKEEFECSYFFIPSYFSIIQFGVSKIPLQGSTELIAYIPLNKQETILNFMNQDSFKNYLYIGLNKPNHTIQVNSNLISLLRR